MHQSMCPVEIGIVEEDGAYDAAEEPALAIIGDFPIHLRPSSPGGSDRAGADQSKDHQGEQGVTDLSPDVGRLWEGGNNLSVEPLAAE